MSQTFKQIQTNEAPAAIGPYSQAIVAGGFMYCSGQIPLDPKTAQMKQESIEVEVKQVLNNLSAIVKAAGAQLGDVVKTTIFLTDLAHFSTVNEIYGTYFKAPFPARSTIQVAALPRGARVEIEAIVKVS